MLAVMNNTKWDELRLAMYHMELSPKWITLSLNGHESNPDREWFYHFKDGGPTLPLSKMPLVFTSKRPEMPFILMAIRRAVRGQGNSSKRFISALSAVGLAGYLIFAR